MDRDSKLYQRSYPPPETQKTKEEIETKEQYTHPTKTRSEISNCNHSNHICLNNIVRYNQPEPENYGKSRTQLSYNSKPEYSNTAEAQEKGHKNNFMKVIEVLKEKNGEKKELRKRQTKNLEEINKSLK